MTINVLHKEASVTKTVHLPCLMHHLLKEQTLTDGLSPFLHPSPSFSPVAKQQNLEINLSKIHGHIDSESALLFVVTSQ